MICTLSDPHWELPQTLKRRKEGLEEPMIASEITASAVFLSI